MIEYPKEGATVGMREDLTGRIESEGWPVIFVQADIPGQPWWCQAPVAKIEGGRFSTKVVFGDEFTPSGTKFRIAGILTRTREEALKFEHRFQGTGPARRLSAIGRGRCHAPVSRRHDAPALAKDEVSPRCTEPTPRGQNE